MSTGKEEYQQKFEHIKKLWCELIVSATDSRTDAYRMIDFIKDKDKELNPPKSGYGEHVNT